MLYIFGDSFASIHGSEEISWTWTNTVAATLAHEQKNYGYGGSGLEYTFEQFEQCRASITQDDLVIICLTEATRVYFFKDHPVISAAESIRHVNPLVRSTITKDQLLAIKYYQTYFEHIHMHKMKFHVVNFLHSANALAAELKIKIVIIDAVLEDNIDCNRYKNLIISNGSLNNVSNNEAVDYEILPAIKSCDKRPNHLCRSNHAILAKKVVDTITTNVALDLTSGFNEKIIKELTFSPEI
jgi:hypothetical protein